VKHGLRNFLEACTTPAVRFPFNPSAVPRFRLS
jgi:hypothetical protein